MKKSAFPFWVSLTVVTAMLQVSMGATAGELSRVVAWGDINYDLTNNFARGGTAVAGIAAGDFHSAVLQRNGSVVIWGDDRFGQD